MNLLVLRRAFRFPEKFGTRLTDEERDRMRPVMARLREIASATKGHIWRIGAPPKRQKRKKETQRWRPQHDVKAYVMPTYGRLPVQVQEAERTRTTGWFFAQEKTGRRRPVGANRK